MIPGAKYTSISAINASGEVAGYYNTGTGGSHGFIDDKGTITAIDVPGAYSTVVTAINASGEVAGQYSDAKGYHGFIDDKGTFTTIDPPGCDVYSG